MILQIPGIRAVHELHIWRLNQKKSLASAHIVLEDEDELDFDKLAKTVNECFHAYGIHSVTLQPETVPSQKASLGDRTVKVAGSRSEDGVERESQAGIGRHCQLVCGNLCEDLYCCE